MGGAVGKSQAARTFFGSNLLGGVSFKDGGTLFFSVLLARHEFGLSTILPCVSFLMMRIFKSNLQRVVCHAYVCNQTKRI